MPRRYKKTRPACLTVLSAQKNLAVASAFRFVLLAVLAFEMLCLSGLSPLPHQTLRLLTFAQKAHLRLSGRRKNHIPATHRACHLIISSVCYNLTFVTPTANPARPPACAPAWQIACHSIRHKWGRLAIPGHVRSRTMRQSPNGMGNRLVCRTMRIQNCCLIPSVNTSFLCPEC